MRRLLPSLSVLVTLLWQPVAGQQPQAGPPPENSAFLWASDDRLPPAGGSLGASARWHLDRAAGRLGASSGDLASARIIRISNAGGDGHVVHLRQSAGGLDVYGGDLKVVMRDNHQLVAISGRPVTAALSGPVVLSLSAAQALATAVSDATGAAVAASSVVDTGVPLASGARALQIEGAAAVQMPDPAAAHPVMFPEGGRLVPAYVVEFYAGAADSTDSAAFRYVIAADDGRVLARHDLTVNERAPDDPTKSAPQFTYRVVADDAGRPTDGPTEDFTPHPTGVPDQVQPGFVSPVLVTTGGFTHYPNWKSDPWLPADATVTNGNNADAYVDHTAPDGLTGTDFRADLTSAGTFDRIYDLTASPVANVDQSKAAITNAFHAVNWLHDYWYISGFDEAAGNAQRDNYGRGGAGNDSMRVEVQDNYFGGSRNNANMSTPSDGLRPRMQIYVWSGASSSSLTLTPGGPKAHGLAAFGPTNFDLTGEIVLANDSVGTVTDACDPIFPAPGRIVLVDRGSCTFVIKASRVQAAGGIGMIVANNVAGAPPGMAGVDPTITIGSMSISQADGAALKTALLGGPVSARLFRFTGTEREGALDNGLIAHEWGHYMHHRLTDCTTNQCRAMSEGWGDFVAVHLSARDGDNLDGTFASGYYTFGQFADAPYYGLRRAPYSVDFTKNPLTFKHISDGQPLPPGVLNFPPNSEVHNAGEIWTSMLWEGYVALQKTRKPGRTFDDVRRRMTDYIVDGLQMAPRDATYTETRDAILAASLFARPSDDPRDRDDRRSLGGDFLELAKAFARRGAGSCAVSPPRDSTNFVGVIESYDLKPKIDVGTVRIEESRGCDNDGIVDAGERGRIVVPIRNSGPIAALGTTVSVTTATAGVQLLSGGSATVATLGPFTSAEVVVEFAVDAAFAGIGQLEVEVHVTNGEACNTDIAATARARLNADATTATTATDTVDSPITAWTATGSVDIWSRIEPTPFNMAWLGRDSGSPSDSQLQSPALAVSTTNPLVVTFDHRHSFELSDANYDGGVIEISRNGGAWHDVSTYLAPGYGGTLFVGSGNPLEGRNAFVGTNAAFPARNTVSLNFGNAFAGESVRIRFRIGTDAAVSDYGWEIDNIAIAGITNTPFSALIAETTVCRVR